MRPANRKFSLCDDLKSFTSERNSVEFVTSCDKVNDKQDVKMHVIGLHLLVRRIMYCAFSVPLVMY